MDPPFSMPRLLVLRRADGGYARQVVRLYYNRARGPLPPTGKVQVRHVREAGLHAAVQLSCTGAPVKGVGVRRSRRLQAAGSAGRVVATRVFTPT